jgi:hypothetical protein
VAFAHSDVGVLNQVVELWRYPSAAACIRWVLVQAEDRDYM